MIIVGQEHIKNEMNILLKEIISGKNYNIILRAPSGYGKTSFLLVAMYNLGWSNCHYFLGSDLNDTYIPRDRRFFFIDEAHLYKEPENIYPLMDSGNFSFFIATNEGGLVEPLLNRCINLIFSPYSNEEIKEMIGIYLSQFNLDNALIERIASFSDNPRRIKKLCDRFQYIFRNVFVPKSNDDLTKLLEKINIDEDGFNSLEKRYLNYLEKMGRASLSTISVATGIHRDMILTEIEPHLLYKNLIKISSRGREYIWQPS